MATRPARRMFIHNFYEYGLTATSIIQDCEDALTNWVSQNASVSSKLSQRSRTLSQRRRNQNRNRGEGVDLSGQDQPLDRESGLWIPPTSTKVMSMRTAMILTMTTLPLSPASTSAEGRMRGPLLPKRCADNAASFPLSVF